jgi:hypothetical protein
MGYLSAGKVDVADERMITSQLTDDKQASVSDLNMFSEVSFRHHHVTRWMLLRYLTDFLWIPIRHLFVNEKDTREMPRKCFPTNLLSRVAYQNRRYAPKTDQGFDKWIERSPGCGFPAAPLSGLLLRSYDSGKGRGLQSS